MTTALLADDEPFMRAALRELLDMLWPELQLVAEAEDGPTALRAIEALQPDIAFLDIRMPGLTGLQVAQAATTATRIVFVTAYDNHAVEAFEADAVDYVLKPLDPGRVARLVGKLKRLAAPGAPAVAAGSTPAWMPALQRLVNAQPAAPQRLEWLQVSIGTAVRMLHVDDVMYFEADSKYTRVVGDDCDGLIRTSLKELMDSVDPRHFVQTHRSTVVNRRFVRTVHRQGDAMELELRGRPERLKVSSANQPLFKSM